MIFYISDGIKLYDIDDTKINIFSSQKTYKLSNGFKETIENVRKLKKCEQKDLNQT